MLLGLPHFFGYLKILENESSFVVLQVHRLNPKEVFYTWRFPHVWDLLTPRPRNQGTKNHPSLSQS